MQSMKSSPSRVKPSLNGNSNAACTASIHLFGAKKPLAFPLICWRVCSNNASISALLDSSIKLVAGIGLPMACFATFKAVVNKSAASVISTNNSQCFTCFD
jgi:hypothetical protein